MGQQQATLPCLQVINSVAMQQACGHSLDQRLNLNDLTFQHLVNYKIQISASTLQVTAKHVSLAELSLQLSTTLPSRQWPQVYDLFFDSSNVQNSATKSDTLGHCLLAMISKAQGTCRKAALLLAFQVVLPKGKKEHQPLALHQFDTDAQSPQSGSVPQKWLRGLRAAGESFITLLESRCNPCCRTHCYSPSANPQVSKAGFCCSFHNHYCLGTASQVTPQELHSMQTHSVLRHGLIWQLTHPVECLCKLARNPYEWLVSNTVDDYFEQQIAQK